MPERRDERARPPGRRAEGVARSGAAKPQIDSIVTDRGDQRQQQIRRLAARELEQLAPLTRYYGPRRPRPIPLGRFLVEGWWVA